MDRELRANSHSAASEHRVGHLVSIRDAAVPQLPEINVVTRMRIVEGVSS